MQMTDDDDTYCYWNMELNNLECTLELCLDWFLGFIEQQWKSQQDDDSQRH